LSLTLLAPLVAVMAIASLAASQLAPLSAPQEQTLDETGSDTLSDAPPTLTRGSTRPGGAAFDLAGTWSLLVDPGAFGMADGWAGDLSDGRVPPTAPGDVLRLPVPGPLEALPQTVTYDGVAWLAHEFELLPADVPAGSHWRLAFERVNYHARVWLDGELQGEHEGGYEAFTLELGALQPGRHVLVVRVLDPGAIRTDGMTLATTPHAKESWYHNFGGVLGDVTLERLDRPVAELTWLTVDARDDEVRADALVVGPPGVREADLRLTVALLAAGSPPGDPGVVVQRKALRVPLVAGRGTASLTAILEDARRWSPESPHRYEARLSVGAEAPLPAGVRAFGLRTLHLGPDGLELDGSPRRLHGVLWQPHFAGTGGMEPDAEALEAELLAIRDAGFDLVRAHVRPAPVALLDAADRVGMLVLEEPAIGWVDDDPALAGRLLSEVDAMVARDHHHPSLVIWGVLNELSGMAYRHGRGLARHLHGRDPSRPVLLDSGGFFGRGGYLDAGPGDTFLPMEDEHLYPAFPLPEHERLRFEGLAHGSGPTFVSEYGFGALVDATTAWEGFAERGLRTDEARLFAGQAGGIARALESAEGWTTDGWVAASRGLQASAALEMTETLRSNPALDLLCYTQWQAVSSESSAGLLEPWGSRRPALDAVRHALRPLLVRVVPGRRSGLAGETLSAELVVVNDTGAPWPAAARVECTGAERAEGGGAVVELDERPWPVGVSRVTLPGLRLGEAGTARLRPLLLSAGSVVEAGSEARVAVLPLRPPLRTLARLDDSAEGDGGQEVAVQLFDVADDPAVADFARRQGFGLADAPESTDDTRVLAVVGRPERLAQDVALPARLALWRHVLGGGTALVFLPDPSQSTFGKLMAGARGRRALVDVPVDVEVAAAGGNFMGRVYPLLEARCEGGVRAPAFATSDVGMPGLESRPVVHPGRPDPSPRPQVRLLSPDESTLTPVAMLAGDLPPGTRPLMLAVGPLGNRIGVPVASVPLGAGSLVFVGLPLLEPVSGRPDASRDAVLAHLVLEAAAEGDWRANTGPPPADPEPALVIDPLEQAAMEDGMSAVRRLSALADRFSVVHGAESLRPLVAAGSTAEMHQGLLALAHGLHHPGRQHLLDAYRLAHTDDIAGFLALEGRVMDGIAHLRRSSDEADLLLAHEATASWEQGVSEWFTGAHEVALAWMGRADLALGESGRLP
jgi:hypothetical protein